MALPACNRGATGSNRDITVNNLGNTGTNRGSTVLHRKCSVVNRGSTGVLLSREPGLYRGNAGKVRTQFIFYEMCPGASRYTGCPASGWTVATSAQWEWDFIFWAKNESGYARRYSLVSAPSEDFDQPAYPTSRDLSLISTLNNMACATSKGWDQSAHTRSLIRAFAIYSRLNILWALEATDWTSFGVSKLKSRLSLHLSKYNVIGNHMSRFIINFDECVKFGKY